MKKKLNKKFSLVEKWAQLHCYINRCGDHAFPCYFFCLKHHTLILLYETAKNRGRLPIQNVTMKELSCAYIPFFFNTYFMIFVTLFKFSIHRYQLHKIHGKIVTIVSSIFF